MKMFSQKLIDRGYDQWRTGTARGFTGLRIAPTDPIPDWLGQRLTPYRRKMGACSAPLVTLTPTSWRCRRSAHCVLTRREGARLLGRDNRRVKRGPIRPASRELATLALVRWRSAYIPDGKAESARALPSRIRCVLRHRRKRSQKLSGINCVAATIQLTGREPATFDCPVDRRFGNACSPCCAVWCVHSALPMRCAKNLLLSFPCSR